MSLYDYEVGREISKHCYPFYALIQAAMRQADTDNARKLQEAWPDVWFDLKARYNAPAGRLNSDKELIPLEVKE